ncbi:MAG: hypothetical protein MR428_08230 [Mesosutterella sp.]|uniref:Uncharacterized protein n=1 Tax=Mesosutterella faecium TaxID=2925194 RepID=A0ABT7IIY8_9BURK|nr:hypothetical protein [Mesosutterella sp. AGMB02718]MCI6531061.1 hypothetical protein [Mesosutterella sp.]MDL2058349.1 hypothetical protein [Mesosutterella sp. AGMB02718]MDL2060585.1 hypothetical protein [Mesosutterella sp. AGMB02718]
MRIEFLKDCLSMIGRRKAGDVEEVYDPYALVLIESGLAQAAKPVAVKPVRSRRAKEEKNE